MIKNLSAAATTGTVVSGVLSVRRFYERIVEAAQQMTDDPQDAPYSFAAAIALTGTACEVGVGTATRTMIIQ